MPERTWREGNPLTLLVVLYIGIAIMEIVWRYLKKQNKATIWPSNLILEHIIREKHDLKGYTHPDIHCSRIYNSEDIETT